MRAALDPAMRRYPVPTVGPIVVARLQRGREKFPSDECRFSAAPNGRALIVDAISRNCAMNGSHDPPRRYHLALHRVKGCYVAALTELPGCVARGESEVEAVENARIALRSWLGITRALGRETVLADLEIAP
jgi:predicted RNase H-like HicB family nuclease